MDLFFTFTPESLIADQEINIYRTMQTQDLKCHNIESNEPKQINI